MYAVSSILEFEYALLFYFIILEGNFFQQGQLRFFTVNTVDDGFFMNCFDNLIAHERDLLFGLQSSLDIHTPCGGVCGGLPLG